MQQHAATARQQPPLRGPAELLAPQAAGASAGRRSGSLDSSPPNSCRAPRWRRSHAARSVGFAPGILTEQPGACGPLAPLLFFQTTCEPLITLHPPCASEAASPHGGPCRRSSAPPACRPPLGRVVCAAIKSPRGGAALPLHVAVPLGWSAWPLATWPAHSLGGHCAGDAPLDAGSTGLAHYTRPPLTAPLLRGSGHVSSPPLPSTLWRR